MVYCNSCSREFKTDRGLKQHLSRNKICKENSQPIFHYFDKLPTEFKMKCLKYLSTNDLYSCLEARMDIFFSKYNDYWKPKCKKLLLTNKKINPISWGIAYVKIVNRICFDCSKRTINTNYFFKIPICFQCQKINPILTMITKTTAKTNYFLNDNDLKSINYFETKNPYYSSGYNMRLYLKSDVDKLVNEKYGDNLDNMKQEKESKKITRIRNKKMKCQERRSDLVYKLSEVGLKIRSDSRLCDNYINGTLSKDWKLEDVVEMCCLMNWLYNYTDYKKKLKEKLDDELSFYKNFGERYYFPDIYEGVESSVRDEIIEKNGGIPDTWPWFN